MPILIKGSGGSGGAVLTITVLADTGSSVTAVKGTLTVSGVAVNNMCVLEVPQDGTWTVTVTKDGASVTDTVNVSPNFELDTYYDPVFANNSWSKIISACESNRVPSTWAIADQKTMTINNRDYLIDIIGKNRDTYSAGGTAPLTFQMHDCYETKYRFNANGELPFGWQTSEIRVATLPSILDLMPSEIKTAIKSVDRKSDYYVDSASSGSTVTTSDKLFLLSPLEITGGNPQYSQYDYYYNGNTMIKNNGSIPSRWITASPILASSEFYYIQFVDESGTLWDYWDRSGSGGPRVFVDGVCGISFAFCF